MACLSHRNHRNHRKGCANANLDDNHIKFRVGMQDIGLKLKQLSKDSWNCVITMTDWHEDH